jgi:hypothetical protein
MRTRKTRWSFIVLTAMLLQLVWVGTALAAVPVITDFNPKTGPVGTTVTITGTGFTGANDVEFDNVNAGSFTVNNDTTITATVPCSLPNGAAVVEVTVPGGGGGTDRTDNATGINDSFVVANAAPTVTNLNPNQGWVGRPVTVTGTVFLCVTNVRFNGTNSTFTVASPTSITTTVPAGATDGQVAVVNPGGTSANTAADDFDVISAPTPTVSSFNPTSGPAGTSVVIMGTGFTGASAVRFGGVNSSFTVNNDGQITATVPATADTGAISVVTSGGTGVSSSSFNVIVGGPVISSFSPTTGLTGTAVQINGSNFNGTTAVKFNGVTATFSIQNDGRINTTVPASATTGKISVTNAAGTTTSSTDFTVTGQGPSITSFNPTAGPVGTSVVITGTGFTNVLTVEFNGRNAGFTVNSSAQITATVPNLATTGKIVVTTTTAAATSATDFVVASMPAITSFFPTAAPIGDAVTLNGSGFTGTSSVKFNGTSATFTVDSSIKITATVPAGATTGKITVTNPAGTATSASDFTVLAPRPTVTSFSPGNGRVGTSVTIIGTNFTGATTVTFNGTASQFVVDSSTTIRAAVPMGASSGKIVVTTPSGPGTSTADFLVTVLHPRSISMTLSKHIVLTGQITVPDGYTGCFVDRSVWIQKKNSGGGWGTIKVAMTSITGAYSTKVSDKPGLYRARAPMASSATDICPKATSPLRGHKHKH